MSSAPHVERFNGTSWEECQEFVAAIRARALWEGKQRDSEWMADFAAPLFWRTALSWHGQLPPEVRQDWIKLEVALFDRWPQLKDDDERQLEPTPAAAPPLHLNCSPDPQLEGVLKVVVGPQNKIFYVTFPDGTNICILTPDASQAIRVRCSTISGATMLERIDRSSSSWLAVQWTSSRPRIKKGSTEYAFMPLIDIETLKSSWLSETPFQLLRCTVLDDGEVTPAWKKKGVNKATLFPFVIGSSFYLGSDREACARSYGDETRAKLFIERTN